MPLSFSADIETEVEAAETGVIDLFEIDLGLGFKKFWSTTQVDIDWVVTEFGSEFEARIISAGDRRWELGLDDDTLSLTISNADGVISRIAKEFGIDIFEGAIVRHHRLFSSIKEIFKDYWCGTGLPMQWSEGVCEWDITFGIASLKQKFGRKIEFSCPHVFAGGLSSDCPYHPLGAAIGVPEPKVVAAATSGTTIAKVFVSGGGLNATSVGWVVFNRDENSFYRITNIVSDTEIDVVFSVVGESGSNALASGDKLLIGPPFTECAKTPEECQERGMYGKHRGNPTGWGTRLRYFGGSAASSFVQFSGRLPNPNERFGHGTADRFTRTSLGNDSLEGSVIPVVIGNYVLRSIPSIFVAPAGAFQHGFFILCEGEIAVFHVIEVNGFGPDNNSPKELDTLTEQLKNDSYIKWGTWDPGGIEDNRVGTSPDLAKQVRQAIGRRRALAVMSGKKVIDTYGDGTHGNPYLFSSATGDGVSTHGLAAVRIRIESQQDIQTNLTGSFAIVGLLVPLAPGVPNNGLTIFNFTGLDDPPGPATLKYTSDPNPIDVAYELLRNRRWGAGLPESRISLPSVVTESAFCEEHIDSVASSSTFISTTVDESSFESPSLAPGVWVFVSVFKSSGSLVGRSITFNKSTDDAFSAKIIQNELFEEIYDDDIDAFDPGIPFSVGAIIGSPGSLIRIDRPFVVGKEPVSGDAVEIGNPIVPRFRANGVMSDDVPIPDMLQSVLDNCNGTFRIKQDKLEFLIRKKLSAAEIDTVISDGIFTDRGVKRNILFTGSGDNRKSTMKVWREDEKSIGNFFTVEFQDHERNFQTSRVAVFNDAAQQKAAKLFGETESRLKIPENLKLIMTITKDQAARLLALRARELFIQNLFCSFTTSLKRGMKALPGDIIAVDSETIAAHFNMQLLLRDVAVGNSFLFRILSKRESSAYTVNFTCQVHVNPIYENFATDFTQFFTPDETQRDRNTLPAPVTPLTPTERIVINSDSSVRSIIEVKITYPGLGV